MTQEDGFFIPQNISMLANHPGLETDHVVILDTAGSLVNRKMMFLRGFGLFQSSKLAIRIACNRLIDALDRLVGYKLPLKKRSIRAVARSCGIPCHVVKNPNDPSFVREISNWSPDVVVSFSAPCVFSPELLAVPRHGCVNLHCSLLPMYAGLLPSFWVLYNGEKQTGATVHVMDDKIDNGPVLCQVKVPLQPGMTMFQVLNDTKKAGGELMLRGLEMLRDQEQVTPRESQEQLQYFSWPEIQQIRDFRKRGGRLI